MKKRKLIRPVVVLMCLVTGIALFFIYSVSFPLIVGESDIAEKTSSKSIVGDEVEEERKLLMAAKADQYTASRGGEYDRLAEAKPAVPPAKPAAPAAPAKPKAAPVKAAAQPESQYASDVDVMARLIMAEAQAEPYEAKVAVGAVVMNRVQSGQWASTIKGVIYQKSGGYYQFTPVENGWINKPADASCVKAAKAAMSGADPTNGAQFYYDDKVTNQWILAKPVSIRIGHMIYAF